MHYFWFIPVFLILIAGIWILYLVVARRLPKTSTRSVEDAQADERAEDAAKAAAGSGTPQ